MEVLDKEKTADRLHADLVGKFKKDGIEGGLSALNECTGDVTVKPGALNDLKAKAVADQADIQKAQNEQAAKKLWGGWRPERKVIRL